MKIIRYNNSTNLTRLKQLWQFTNQICKQIIYCIFRLYIQTDHKVQVEAVIGDLIRAELGFKQKITEQSTVLFYFNINSMTNNEHHHTYQSAVVFIIMESHYLLFL